MKNIFEVLKEKEEQLREKKQAIKLLEEQVTKLRGAIQIFEEVMKAEESTAALNVADDPLNLNVRPVAAAAAAPSRNWP